MTPTGDTRLITIHHFSRPYLIISLPLLAILTLGGTPGHCQTLNRATTFDVTTQLPEAYRNHHAALEHFVVKNDGLYFLFSAGTPRRYQLLHTDLAGNRLGALLDPTTGDSLYGLAVDDAGKAIIYSGTSGGAYSIIECDVHASSVTSGTIQSVPFLPTFLGNHLVGFLRDGTLRYFSTPTRYAPKSIPTLKVNSFLVNRVSVARLTGDRLVLVDQTDGSLTIVNPKNNTTALVSLKSSGLQNAITLSHTLAAIAKAPTSQAESSRGCCNTVRTAVAYASAADAAGYIYIGLGPYKPTEGAPILQVGEDGQEIRLMRCPLVLPYGTPAHIGVVNNTLVLASHWGMISMYNLD